MIYPRWPREPYRYGDDEPLQVTALEWDAMVNASPETYRRLAEAQGPRFPPWQAAELGLCIVCQRPNYDMDRLTCECCRDPICEPEPE